ncbi:response regulator transcription factor [Paenibacillus sp.]|uniref:response regulator transcription factor n=1 Tax=Paenibacillus sp. TaxID=58172 RepID=UPI002D75C42B|nr:response regulator [Paenibacillus sp.]HZG86091.1 response regulator [Paenibacillus sp.]
MSGTAEAWKMMIADDEWIIRDGLKDVIPWEKLGIALAAEAEDGEQALELAIEQRVDLVLADINMPIMNGLELISKLRSALPDAKVVILTGHDEFSYAQEAIRLQVDDYLLKPVQPEQLSQVLAKLTEELERERRQEAHLNAASKQIEKNLTLLRERFCLEWVDGTLAEEEIQDQLTFLQLPSVAPRAVGVARWLGLARSGEWIGEKDKQLHLYAMENIALELLAPHRAVAFRERSGMIAFLVWGRPDDDVPGRIEAAISKYLKASSVVCFERNEQGLAGVSSSYQAAKAAVYKQTQLSPLAKKAKEIVEQRYGDPELSLERIAGELNVSAVYLSRLFKQEAGISFVHYVSQTRVKHAIRLLTGTDLAMHEIAERIGYESQHYFSTAFKRATGYSPIQYRKETPKG